MEIHNLGELDSLIAHYVYELRHKEIQLDRLRFRTNMYRIGILMGYEISKRLLYEPKHVVTPLGEMEMNLIKNYPVLITILRAGLPLHEGLLFAFDKADCGFVSAYRKHHKSGQFTIQVEYVNAPSLDGRVLILSDPMLATGSSLLVTLEQLFNHGQPTEIHVVSVISSVVGINYLKKNVFFEPFHIWTAAIDEELTAQAYIVPGLGDAGDLAFGSKE